MQNTTEQKEKGKILVDLRKTKPNKEPCLFSMEE